MATQLALLDSTAPDWKIDPETREIGRRGIAEAREALRRATARTEQVPGSSSSASTSASKAA